MTQFENLSPNPSAIDADTLTGDMHPIRRCVISLGSNLGERMYALQGALEALGDTPEVWITGVSSVYETEPVDAPEGSKTFLNAVVTLDTTLAARTLLERAHAVEAAYGRERGGDVGVNAPRTLDVDLIVVGDRHADDENLTLPHPRAAERAFVLVPWLEVEPDAELPGRGPVADLVEKVGRDGVVLREDLVLDVT
ncbi:MAG: 2-amino-4-hydroxy-6-hydroxymethyldihydropteridine diphosphokinase [Propionibacteriales bacterium]|nr:2-amino-4-hydroxy-6-hydroxymethyldihydropteridine diphosphokinase [Propionibacteriales bacterium]